MVYFQRLAASLGRSQRLPCCSPIRRTPAQAQTGLEKRQTSRKTLNGLHKLHQIALSTVCLLFHDSEATAPPRVIRSSICSTSHTALQAARQGKATYALSVIAGFY